MGLAGRASVLLFAAAVLGATGVGACGLEDQGIDVEPEDGGGAAGSAGASTTDAPSDQPPEASCWGPKKSCGGKCVEFGDPAYGCGPSACGACHLANATAACSNGACVVAKCDADYQDCDANPSNGCEAYLRSADNCGGCGTKCAPPHATSSCATGKCVVVTCETGYADCNKNPADGCEVDTRVSVDHCGGCGLACPPGNGCSVANCVSGKCGIASCACGKADCNGDPADGCEVSILVDPYHCGKCGNACVVANGTGTCNGGKCQIKDCKPPYADCDKDYATGCETPTNTPTNCAGCGVPCNPANANGQCSTGTCLVQSCKGTFDNCNGSAADGCESDVTVDPANCGACKNKCSFPNVAVPVCSGGACGIGQCAIGWANCDGNQANGCEINLAGDPANCGACGKTCPAVVHATPGCAGGACGIAACDGGWGNCDGNALTGCETDTTQNLAHCGGCGKNCSPPNATPACAGSQCKIASCYPSWADCNGSPADGCEVNTSTSTAHCGGCGKACNLPNATAKCDAGACAILSCNAGWADCNGSPADGCEVNITTNAAHCGGCGWACEGTNVAAKACVGGKCAPTCTAGFGDCDGPQTGNLDNGCEQDLTANTNHCGGCNWACEGANVAAKACVSGKCAPTCTAGFGDCNGPQAGNVDDGCETSTLTNASHCGGCGFACESTGVATKACGAGKCTPTCVAGRADCNGPQAGNVDDGCEIDTTADPGHCGGCGFACETGPNVATTKCTASKCAPTCTAGFGDCNGPQAGNLDDGCEVDLTSNPNHCGGCGYACESTNVASKACVASKCAPTCSAGFGDCNGPQPGNSDDGCEVNTTNHPSHCGGCGFACEGTNVASKQCTDSKCAPYCAAGWGDCNGPEAGDKDDGCETDVGTNDAKCGSCQNDCTKQGQGSKLVCDGGSRPKNVCGCDGNGVCGPGATCDTTTGLCTCDAGPPPIVCARGESCESGACKCNGSNACTFGSTCCQTPAGCKNLSMDASNCGACGRACPTGFSCAAGACRCTSNSVCNSGGTLGACNFVTGVCSCGATVCAAGQRCLPGNTCG